MTDLSRVCPQFPHNALTASLLTSFDNTGLATTDVLVLSPETVAKRIGRNVVDVRRFVELLKRNLSAAEPVSAAKTQLHFITTGDKLIDEALGGQGIPTGCISEVTGPSGVGKSHFLMQLCLTVQLSTVNGGIGRMAVYISTESGLETKRLNQLLDGVKEQYPEESKVSTSCVMCVTCGDLEEQEHIIRYQLPHLVKTQNIGLIVLDSIASHYRAEHGNRGGQSLHKRGNELVQCAEILRNLALQYGCAVVIANQVKDIQDNENDVFSLDYQARFFSGWDYTTYEEKKVPALGLIWSNCIVQRIVLKRTSTSRTMRLIFSPYAVGSRDLEYKIEYSGIKGIAFAD
ncbi:DNA repair protein-like protein rhp57 [Lipomyces arxii]|uniref:DNA repair protein-like protein rhp57 n=1 Tax=Lipomyces arxii TaxID=56418 RepID=UPI0034CDB375